MGFAIRYSEEAALQLRGIDNANAKRIIGRIGKASGNPLHFFRRLAGRDEYKLRVGDYRVIAHVMLNERVIFICSVGHRKKIYRQ